jgi:hypothetical protein
MAVWACCRRDQAHWQETRGLACRLHVDFKRTERADCVNSKMSSVDHRSMI